MLEAPSLLPVYQRQRLEMLRGGPRFYNPRDTLNGGLERASYIQRTGNVDRNGRPEWAITAAGLSALPRPRSVR